MTYDYYPYEEHKMFLKDMELLPCPFCGKHPHLFSCDRLISIGCDDCGYSRSFHGLVQTEINTGVVASCNQNTNEPVEWYDKDAYVNATKKWNTRTEVSLKRPDCEHAEHDAYGCLGYCECTQDDEPIEPCKRCEKYTGNISEAVKW